MESWVYEAIGYLASVLVAISLMMSSVVRLRIINMTGAFVFVIYGLLIQAYPVAGMNAFIVGVNLYYLWQMRRETASYDVIEVAPDAPYLHAFLDHYRDDLYTYCPEAPALLTAEHRAFLILREAMPVGVVLGRAGADETFEVEADYVIPGYRDLSPGKHFYEQYAPALRGEGYERLCTVPGPDSHAAYLRRMGYAPNGSETYCRPL